MSHIKNKKFKNAKRKNNSKEQAIKLQIKIFEAEEKKMEVEIKKLEAEQKILKTEQNFKMKCIKYISLFALICSVFCVIAPPEYKLQIFKLSCVAISQIGHVLYYKQQISQRT